MILVRIFFMIWTCLLETLLGGKVYRKDVVLG
jgi:hypothetical protein